MRTGISIDVTAEDRRRLEAVVADRNTPQKHVWRARIVLLSAAGAGTTAIMREAGVSKTAVWRWQERFMAEGVDGLLRDKTRPPGRAPVTSERVAASHQWTLSGESGSSRHQASGDLAPTFRRRRWVVSLGVV